MNNELPENDGENRAHDESIASSPIFSIPCELRQLIYEELWPLDIPKGELISLNEPCLEAALLLTCRQIHDEAKDTFAAAKRAHLSRAHFWIDDGTVIYIPSDESDDSETSGDSDEGSDALSGSGATRRLWIEYRARRR